MQNQTIFFPFSDRPLANRAFRVGDAVQVSFFVRQNQLVMAEECYFFLMACMRKMRMKIDIQYTLEFFQDLFQKEIIAKSLGDGIINFMVYREESDGPLQKSDVVFWFSFSKGDVLALQPGIEMDLIKEINVNNNLLSNIRVHCPENIYAEIYALENDLQDVILLNPNKRIARSIFGNLLFLEGKTIKVPKQSEGAYISPLMENFITYIHRQQLAEIEPAEMIAFESQKADEVLIISDEKGLIPVKKIRNKTFAADVFSGLVDQWRTSFNA